MVRDPRDRRTSDLLAWKPPEPPRPHYREELRAATLNAKFCRAMAMALKDCGLSRAQVAERMTQYLGEAVSENTLNAYVSEARIDHIVNVLRFAALIHATQDWRLLSILPDLFGFAVLPERFVAAAEEAMCDDAIEQAVARKRMLRRKWKGAP
ncbi:MAG: DNA transposition protein [Alphaproteobacteria bacterium]|nr:DNA transposition protein [Alphaproteobacteria bacterium]MBF0333176.1 DNA transposition protein [Alphaproteobacteria bacterium]